MNEAVKPWERVWDIAKFDDLYNRDERFFSVLLKGMLGWLNNNIVLYGKPIKHFFHSTGSSYMYVENNGYYYSMNETSGEDYIYMQMPRCIIELAGINIPTEELTSPFAHGVYERKDGENIRGFYAQMRRIPIELDINLKYVLSNFNESIILAEEIISKEHDHVILDASLPAKQIYLKRGYVATKYNMIETENEDYLCFDVMEKHL